MLTFNCPIHKDGVFEIIEIDAMVDSWQEAKCSTCKVIEGHSRAIEQWFNSNNNKLDTNIKNKIKEGYYKYYNISEFFSFGGTSLLDSYTEYKYLNNKITKIQIYKYCENWFGNPNRANNFPWYKTRLFIQQNKIAYKDLKNYIDLPLYIADKNWYLTHLLSTV